MCAAVLHCVYAYVHNHQPTLSVDCVCHNHKYCISSGVSPPQCIGVAITYELVDRLVEPITVYQVAVASQTELQMCLRRILCG